ncbi:MAG: hypothetical protein RL556_462 [Actinomycetota bacterium]|jgi:hypothetical protein
MARRKIDQAAGLAAARSVMAGEVPRENSNPVFAMAVRFLLEELAVRMPGNSVEVRVPPLMAVQCVPGPQHRRGTPANVAELSPQAWFALAVGEKTWQELEPSEAIVSGTRASEFTHVLPLLR